MESKKQQSSLLPVYLVSGEDELKRETVVKRLHQRLEQFGDLSFNSDFFQGETAAGSDIVSAANTLPFASEVRLVQVNNTEKLKKADSAAIVEYLKNPAPTTVLALVAQKTPKNSVLYKTVVGISKTAFIDCAPFARKDLNGAVRSMALSHGVTFTQGAASALIDLVGSNTVALDGNIKKIALGHRGNDAVNESEVLSLVARTTEIKPWEFVDAFSARNLSRCIYLLHRMESVSPYALLAMCVTRIRELISAKALATRGESARLAGILKMPDWRVKNHQLWARSFSAAELRDGLARARDVEKAMKSGEEPHAAFIDWMIAVLSR